MTEQFSFSPEQSSEREPTIQEVLDAALADGIIEPDDLRYFGTDRQDILTAVASYAAAADVDFEDFLEKWGIIIEYNQEGDFS